MTIRQHLANARALLGDARQEINSTHGRFIMAYEGVHCLALAFLNHHETRTSGEGHRALALVLFMQQIGLNQYAPAIDRLHRMRNDIVYHRPAPPVDRQTVELVVTVLEAALPLTEALAAGGE